MSTGVEVMESKHCTTFELMVALVAEEGAPWPVRRFAGAKPIREVREESRTRCRGRYTARLLQSGMRTVALWWCKEAGMAPWPTHVLDRMLKLGSEKEDSKEVEEHGVLGC
jgi:hypothetical protein